MTIYAVSVSEFKAHCLDVIRQVEKAGAAGADNIRPLTHWLTTAAAAESVTLLPMDVAVILTLDRLPAGFYGDPANRIIVATARAHGLPLVTRDTNIRRSRTVKIRKS